MARFTTLFLALATVLSATSAAPAPVEEAIEKRTTTRSGRVCFDCSHRESKRLY